MHGLDDLAGVDALEMRATQRRVAGRDVCHTRDVELSWVTVGALSGRGRYLRDPDGHSLESLTRPITDTS
jgi:hypothetical protein